MDSKLNTALQNLECTYKELVEIANDIVLNYLQPINQLIETIQVQLNSLSIDALRTYMLELQLKAWSLSEVKEKSAMKAELAEAIQKEAFAISFNKLDGSATVKNNAALVEISGQVGTTVLCDLVSGLLKTKLDEIHRIVDCLKSILMSKMQETKFMNVGIDNEIPATRRINLSE